MACMAFYSFQNNNTINKNHEKQIKNEATYWKLILDKIITTTLTLAQLNIFHFVSTEKIMRQKTKVNF